MKLKSAKIVLKVFNNISFSLFFKYTQEIEIIAADNTDYILTVDDYKIDNSADGKGTIILKNDYLSRLKVGVYTLTVSYNPMGESYVEGNDNEAPVKTQFSLTVKDVEAIEESKLDMPDKNVASNGNITSATDNKSTEVVVIKTGNTSEKEKVIDVAVYHLFSL